MPSAEPRELSSSYDREEAICPHTGFRSIISFGDVELFSRGAVNDLECVHERLGFRAIIPIHSPLPYFGAGGFSAIRTILTFRLLFAYHRIGIGARGHVMGLPIASVKTEQPAKSNPWVLPDRTLTVLYGCPEIQRLSHYFLPRILLNHQRVLYLDGANQISPLLIARFARERGLEPSALNKLVLIARAFTCFQLTALIRQVPEHLAKFSADVLIVTALPDLYFDEDVQEGPARASFEHALEGLRELAPLPLSIAVFSDATSFKTKRRDFLQKLRNQADHMLKAEPGPESKLSFTREKNTPLLSI